MAVEKDIEVKAALDWFAKISGDASVFWRRIDDAQAIYRSTATCESNLGRDIELEMLGDDKAGSYLGQAAALLQDRYSYDLRLGSRIIPFIKTLGSGVKLLEKIPGAAERANRLLCNKSVDPESAIFELAAAISYAKVGFSVEFIQETPGGARRPDFRIKHQDLSAEVECKRLQKSSYEKAELDYQLQQFNSFSDIVKKHRLNLHVDITYTQELRAIPKDYLCGWVRKALGSSSLGKTDFAWSDEYGRGCIKPSDVAAVRKDIESSNLFIGPKLARLLTGQIVYEGTYNLAVGATLDARDARFMEQLDYGSIVTWECVAQNSIDARSRFIRSKMSEIDKQLKSSPYGIFHIAMDAERDMATSDLRRKKNIEVFDTFQFESRMIVGYLHYFVSRVTEVSAWLIDETVDQMGGERTWPAWQGRIFSSAKKINNNLPAWHQLPPPPPPVG